jgi:stage II sporulation protein M
MVNGYVLGYISKITVQSSSILDLWRLFPHGIFELPAVLISLGLGLKLGFSVINNLEIFKNKKDYWNSLIKEIKLCVKTFIFIVLILLVFAAIIEGILIRLIS